MLAFVVYCMAGTVVWRRRAELDGYLNPLNEEPFGSEITTQVTITHEEPHQLPTVPPAVHTSESGVESGIEPGFDQYTVNIEVDPHEKTVPTMPSVFRVRSLTRTAAFSESNCEALLYARVAFLFFVALLISWVGQLK